MALTVKPGKTPLVFEYDDGVVSSSIKILPEDDEATIVAKLKRVIALVEGEQVQAWHASHGNGASGPWVTDDEYARQGLVPAVPKATEPPQLGPQQAANGWEMLGADDLQDAPGESG